MISIIIIRNIMKKIIPLIVITLIFPLFMNSVAEYSNNIIYVDDDNTEGPWDGSPEHPFQFIQNGIEWANNGDIVYVKSGLYEENIRINKQIEIIGEEKNSTIISSINKSEYLIIDSVVNIIIENITFSCENNERLDIIKMINCINCTISKIKIISNKLQRSAIIINGSNNIIKNVTINGRFIFSGIELYYTDNNIVSNNIIESTGGAILIHRSNNNLISSNIIRNNTNGIYIEEGNSNYITKNILEKNNRGLYSSYSIKNIIEKNNFLENDEHAKFTKLLKKDFLPPNKWMSNYWDDLKGFFISSYRALESL